MKDMAADIPLPRPTSATVKGPTLQFEYPTLIVAYDYERDDGVIEWTRLLFNDVLAYEYRQMACCEVEHIIGYKAIKRFLESKWLADVLKVLQEAVSWQEWQQQQGGEKRYKHVRVLFDDAVCVDV